MTDVYVLLAFAVCLLCIAGAAYRQISWFAAGVVVIATLFLLALIGHWPQ